MAIEDEDVVSTTQTPTGGQPPAGSESGAAPTDVDLSVAPTLNMAPPTITPETPELAAVTTTTTEVTPPATDVTPTTDGPTAPAIDTTLAPTIDTAPPTIEIQPTTDTVAVSATSTTTDVAPGVSTDNGPTLMQELGGMLGTWRNGNDVAEALVADEKPRDTVQTDQPAATGNEPPPENENRFSGATNLQQALQVAESLGNPNQHEAALIHELKIVEADLARDEAAGYTIDKSAIPFDATATPYQARMSAELAIEKQKAIEDQDDPVKKKEQERETAIETELLTQTLIGAERWDQGRSGQAGGAITAELNMLNAIMVPEGQQTVGNDKFIRTDNPIHPNNLPNMPQGFDFAQLRQDAMQLLAMTTPGLAQAPSLGALTSHTNHGLGGTGLGQNVGGPPQAVVS